MNVSADSPRRAERLERSRRLSQGSVRRSHLPEQLQFGVFICYEQFIRERSGEFAAKGANLFINISNERLVRKSAAAEQHLRMARVRAVENRKCSAITNSGITAAIDPYGRIYETIPWNVRGRWIALQFRTDTTLYTRFRLVAWMCVLISVFCTTNFLEENMILEDLPVSL